MQKAVSRQKNLRNGMDEIKKMEDAGEYFSYKEKDALEKMFSEALHLKK